MTDYRSAHARPTKNEKRAEAREKARVLREEHKKKERRNTVLLQGGIAIAALAIIAIIALVLVNSVRPDGPGPRNMASDGIKIGEGLVPVTTAALGVDDEPVTSEANADGVVDIQIWVDYLCPICGEFEAVNGPLIRTLVESGAATVEYRPIAILTNLSAGTQYSLRAANAAACVADYSPNAFFDFNELLFANQPEEGSAGLDNAQLIEFARDAGSASTQIESCINDEKFGAWVQASTARALAGPLPVRDTQVESVQGTPTILVNGQLFEYRFPFEASDFSQFILQAAGDEFSTNPTPTPTPTPTP